MPARNYKPNFTGLLEAALCQLVAGGLITAVHVATGEGGTYQVLAEMGAGRAQLLNSRGQPRIFRSLDTAAAAVARLGAREFITHLTTPQTR